MASINITSNYKFFSLSSILNKLIKDLELTALLSDNQTISLGFQFIHFYITQKIFGIKIYKTITLR